MTPALRRRIASASFPRLAVLLLAPTLAAQHFVLDARADLGAAGARGFADAIFAVDFDSDGLLDVVASVDPNSLPTAALRRGLGAGRFAELPSAVSTGLVFAVADLDIDGRLELISDRGVLRVMPDGSLVPTVMQLGGGRAALGDLDGDGDLDAIRDQDGLAVWLQTSRGAFARSTGLAGAAGSALLLSDADRDGDLDLLVARSGARNGLYLNDGRGAFTDVSGTLPGGVENSIGLCSADFDGDGRADVLVVNAAPDRPRLLLGSPAGFVDASLRLGLPAGNWIAAGSGDLDRDGDVDLVVASAGSGVVLRNLGSSWFVAVTGAWPAPSSQVGIALADVDQDGDLDLLVAGACDRDREHFNDGTGRFAGPVVAESAFPRIDEARARSAAAGDFDGDGDVDLAVPGTTWLNDGFGAFTAVANALPASPNFEVKVACGPLDTGGGDDLVIADRPDSFGVWFGTPSGFVPGPRLAINVPTVGFPFVAETAAAAFACDLDRDGDLDLLCSTLVPVRGYGETVVTPDSLWRNDGSGNFAEDPNFAVGFVPMLGAAVAFGDLNGDGRTDFLAASGTHLQRADGRFGFVSGSAIPAFLGNLALGDLDGDGDLDGYLARNCRGTIACTGVPDVLLWNDGRGVMTPQYLWDQNESTDVVLVDVDGDVDLDIALAQLGAARHSFPANVVLLNQGARVFRPALSPAEFEAVHDPSWRIFARDFDGDGDTDILSVDATVAALRGASIWWSTTRQLRATDLLRIGFPYRLELFGGTAGGLIAMALAPAAIPLPPLGTLGMDPAAAVVLAVLSPPAQGRATTHVVDVPNEPALLGASLVFQGLVAEAPATLRLTNRIVETVRW